MERILSLNEQAEMSSIMWAEKILSIYPTTTKAIYLSNYGFKAFPSLAKYTNLEILSITDNSLTELPELPPSLKVLYCGNGCSQSKGSKGNNRIKDFSKLPEGLKVLSCSNSKLTHLGELPIKLQQLIADDNLLSSLPVLPSTLTHLEVTRNCLERLPELPESLEILRAENNLLTELPDFPHGIKVINVRINNLVSIPELPTSLSMLDVGCTNITHLPELPDGLRNFLCDNTPNLYELPNFSKTLIYIDVSANPLLTSFPRFPDNIETFTANNCIGITELPNINHCHYLQDLNVSNCSITRLPQLPNTIEYLDVEGNPIYIMKNIPEALNPMESSIEGIPIFKEVLYTDEHEFDDYYRFELAREKLNTLNRFREFRYETMFKEKLRNWLWLKVRLPRIERVNHPDRLREALENSDSEDELINAVETFATSTNHSL